jgi:hypothetical protein
MPADTPLLPLPAVAGVGQLYWRIEHVAEGRLPVSELITSFRGLHEREWNDEAAVLAEVQRVHTALKDL